MLNKIILDILWLKIRNYIYDYLWQQGFILWQQPILIKKQNQK